MTQLACDVFNIVQQAMAVEILLITPNPWLLQQLNLTLTDQGFRIKLAVNKRPPHNIFSQDQHSCRYLQVQIIENLGVI